MPDRRTRKRRLWRARRRRACEWRHPASIREDDTITVVEPPATVHSVLSPTAAGAGEARPPQRRALRAQPSQRDQLRKRLRDQSGVPGLRRRAAPRDDGRPRPRRHRGTRSHDGLPHRGGGLGRRRGPAMPRPMRGRAATPCAPASGTSPTEPPPRPGATPYWRDTAWRVRSCSSIVWTWATRSSSSGSGHATSTP